MQVVLCEHDLHTVSELCPQQIRHLSGEYSGALSENGIKPQIGSANVICSGKCGNNVFLDVNVFC